MDHGFPPPPHQVAIVRIAHIAGSALAWVEFWDGSIYAIEPFRDDDWVELMRHHASAGSYFNQIVRKRPSFRYVFQAGWPSNIGSSHAWLVHVYRPQFP